MPEAPNAEIDGTVVSQGETAPGFEGFLTRRRERWMVVGLLVLCAVNLVAAAIRNTGVADELGAHIPGGYLYWTSGQYSGGIDNFPLAQLWIALPVHLLGLDYELFTEQHLLLFRIPVMVLGLLVALAAYLMARRLWGPVAGVASLFAASLSPNLLAHSSIATLDLPTTWAVVTTVFLLYRYMEAPSIGRLTAASVAIAVALVVKIQAFLLLPIAVVALALAAVGQVRKGRASLLATVASWLLIPSVVVVVVNLLYLQVPFAQGHVFPDPYLEAIRVKLSHGSGGHFAYLLGRYSSQGWWYYFPLAILFKTPIPALVLVAVGLTRRLSLPTLVFVVLPIVLFLGAGMAGNLDIGLRHVLPIYPFLFMLAGAGAAQLDSRGWRRILLGVLAVAMAAEALWIQPHHLSYFNLLGGGARNGHRILLDSNYDWGQNDRFLERHVARAGLECQIDPDAFRPASGPILVNANARYGILNGGPAAYPWLRDLEPVDQIAYTWFEYRLPERSDPELLAQWQRLDRLGGHFLHLRGETAFSDPRLRLTLAQTLAAVTLYGPAFNEIRSVLDEHPEHEGALRLGGELVVRHKLGVLRYRGDEYLTGFREPPAAVSLQPHEVVDLALAAEVGEPTSTLYTMLGSAWLGERRLGDAMIATRMAVALDPSNGVARDNLQQLEIIARRQ